MSFFYQNPLILVVILTIVLSPFILIIASNQNKNVKNKLRLVFFCILAVQIILGFFNWENFKELGRSGYELALNFPQSYLGFVFVISLLQIILILINKSFTTLAVVLNFINTILIFIAMSRLSSNLGFQAVSLSSIGAVFLILIGNVVALAFINKDKNIFKKYPFLK